MQSPHVRKRNIIKGGLYIILLTCFFQKGVLEGVLEKNPFLSAQNWLNKKRFEISNPERKEDHHPKPKSHNVGS